MTDRNEYPQQTFREWLEDTLEPDTLRDLCQYGASAGFGGLTYYSDTVALYDRYDDEIWQRLYEDAESFGYDTPLAFVASFNGAHNVADTTTFKNLAVWYMAETVAREITDEREDS